MHLFCAICIFFFSFSLRLGYHIEQAQSKCGWMRAFHSILRSIGVRNLFHGTWILVSRLFCSMLFKTIGSPDNVSCKTEPRYATHECCFTFVSLYFIIFSFLTLFILHNFYFDTVYVEVTDKQALGLTSCQTH